MLTFLGPGTGRLPENHLSIHSEQGTCSYEHSQHLAQQKCCFRLLVLSMSADQTLPQEAKFTETPRCFITTARYPYGVALKWMRDLLGWARARLWHPLPPFGTDVLSTPLRPSLGRNSPQDCPTLPGPVLHDQTFASTLKDVKEKEQTLHTKATCRTALNVLGEMPKPLAPQPLHIDSAPVLTSLFDF